MSGGRSGDAGGTHLLAQPDLAAWPLERLFLPRGRAFELAANLGDVREHGAAVGSGGGRTALVLRASLGNISVV